MLLLSTGAELISNDKPLLAHYQGQWLSPLLDNPPETRFGGDFGTPTDWKDPFITERFEQPGHSLWRTLNPHSAISVDYFAKEQSPAPPSAQNWLGTDSIGRDMVARLIYGFRISVLFGLVLTLFSSIIGIAAGAVQGFFGGWLDLGFQRFIEVWSGLPQLFLLIILASVIEPSFWLLLGLLLLFSWMSLVDVVRAEFLRVRNFDYIRAARALGVRDTTIIVRHALPNAMVSALTFLPFILNGSITTLTALDFLGFGLPPGSPSLGELLQQGKANLQAPWLGFTGFFVIALMLSLMIFVGEAVRDAFDPRKLTGR